MTPEEPETPEEVDYLLDWFEQLSATRTSGMSGPNPLSPSDVLAWSELTGSKISPNEYLILRAMDAAHVDGVHTFLKEQREISASEPTPPAPPPRRYK